MKQRLYVFLAGLFVLLAAAPVLADTSSGGNYVLNGMVRNGAGIASGGTFELGGSVGQANAVVGSGGYQQTSGFWSIPLLNLVNNGDFTDPIGTANLNWSPFGDPAGAIQSQVTGGVMEWYAVPSALQAVVLQNTQQPLPNDAVMRATLQLGNNSAGRKRVSILIHDSDFSDITFCTFWLPPNQPLKTYTMLTHTTKAWGGATMSVYAATKDNLGWYRMDNVILQYEPTMTLDETRCIDPNTPAPPGGANGANMVSNGTFNSGFGSGTDSWSYFYEIFAQITGGQLQFYRTGTPNGVVLQNTTTAVAANRPIEISMQIGNQSNERRRITLLLHASDFSDLQACTFYLPPNTPLGTYVVQTYTTQAWGAASISIYPATVATSGFFVVDNVVYRQRPGLALTGTGCYEPGSSPAEEINFAEALIQPTLLPTATHLPLLYNEGMPAEMPIIVTPIPYVPSSPDEGTIGE